MLSPEDFFAYGDAGYSHVPLWQQLTLPAGVQALSLYEALANRGQDYLFETGQWQQGTYAQTCSVIGLPCRQRVELDEGVMRVYSDGQLASVTESPDPLAAFSALQDEFRIPQCPGLPPFSGGFFGYFGFETTRLIEPRLRNAPRKPSGFGLPDVLQLISTDLIVLDHVEQQIYCIVHERPRALGDYQAGQDRLNQLVARVRPLLVPSAPSTRAAPTPLSEAESSFPRPAFIEAVTRIKDYIAAGDVMQVVLSQRMSQPFEQDAISLYRSLAQLGHTPYRYLLNLGDHQVVGASPEMLFRQAGQRVTTRPMAGTRRRGDSAAEDARLKEELLADPKEVAEHMMLVDLSRNDLGRLASVGSVQVSQLLDVEYFSHVMHIVSTVIGDVPDSVSGLELLKSLFPAGTLSGASKVRALEIIAELEPHARGVYGGAIGYLDWSGRANLAIAIRTGLLHEGRLYVQAGAGVVQDSVAEREWQETIEKSQIIRVAAARCKTATPYQEVAYALNDR
ncbi:MULTISPECIES: anthranilate synthase component I family protein [unclassified Pseudomonas]|uniref:anthranilate synthase component I family protein n=1 Tax=unclassified Pseudomonas TaxID=196821 RepID=UPI001E36F0EC|nr:MULTISPECIES: chorismate-binding protein [unclassified Pseudomonas]MEB0106256.1 chorismate-binding protein [Pseudomonas sp. MH9.3]WPX78579.1 chorismate-binding protein [Pseudomonas sp. MH9.3]